MIQEVLALYDEVRTELYNLKISPNKLAIVKKRIEEAKETELAIARQFLVDFKKNQIAAYKKAKSLAPELALRLYELAGGPPSYEEQQIKATKKDLLETWKNRPHILTRNPNVSISKKGRGTGKDNKRPSKKAGNTGKSH